MKIIEKNSIFTESIDFTLSETDQQVFALLYMPIIKAESFALYQALLHLKSTSSLTEYITHEALLSDLGLPEVSFLKAREKLEAIGLLDTYRNEKIDEKGNVKVFYHYHLLPPASPKKFFSDILLRALLQQAVGAKRYYLLLGIFRQKGNAGLEEYEKISAKFNEVYTLNLSPDDPAMSDGGNVFVDKNYKNQSSFDKETFLDYLKSSNLPIDSLQDAIEEAIEVATLYAIDSQSAFSMFLNSLDSENHFYGEHFKKQVRNINRYQKVEEVARDKVSLGQGDSSSKIRYLERTTPKEFLQDYFHAEPALFMLKTIEHLHFDLQLNNSVITAILDYSLEKTNGEFNATFIEKVGYSLSGKHITDAYEALVYFGGREFERKKAESPTGYKKTSKTTNKTETKKTEEVSENDIRSLAEDLGL